MKQNLSVDLKINADWKYFFYLRKKADMFKEFSALRNFLF